MSTRQYSFGLGVRTLQLSGARVAYLEAGQGPPILLLHGAPLTSLAFARLIRALSRTHRVLAPDLPGFGDSELPRGFGGQLADYAEFVEAFCGALDLRAVTLYVNDSSGSFGIYAAARMPERLAGLIVADTVPVPLRGRATLVRLVLKFVVGSALFRAVNRWLNLLPWLVATVVPLLRPFSREERRALVGEFASTSKRERVLDLLEAVGRDDSFLRRTEALARAHLQHLPVLVLFGQFDPMRFVGGPSRYRALFARSSSAIVAWEEHFPFLASAERVAEAVRTWLAAQQEPKS